MAGAEPEDAGNDEVEHDPRGRLMQEVAAQMDAIEADFGDDYEIGALITIVEVKRADGSVGVRVRNNAPLWVALGMLQLAQKAIESQGGE